MASAPTATVKSATRVIEVLEFFRDHREPRSLKQLTQLKGVGPLVLVETRKDLSQLKLPFEQQAH